jgi:hypothetical protein
MDAAPRPAPRPEDAPRFLADAMLGRLATWLRILGYDAAYSLADDSEVIEAARCEQRILLTRDTGLLRRSGLPPHLFIRSDHVMEQVRQVVDTLRLPVRLSTADRCPRCNVRLEAAEKSRVVGRVPDFVWSCHDAFRDCPRCGRVYWPGSHRRRMEEAIRALGS